MRHIKYFLTSHICKSMLALTITAFSLDLLAADETPIELPPGIVTCNDEAVITAYRYAVTDKKWLPEYNQDSDVVAKWIMSGKKTPHNLPKLATNTPFLEPCYYFTAAKLGMLDQTPRVKSIEERNVALAYFKKGLQRYFSRWVTHDYGGSSIETTERDIMINFHRAVLSASSSSNGLNYQDDDYRWFKRLTDREKKQYYYSVSFNLKPQFEKYILGLNGKGSADQEFNKNRPLIAQWSAFLLASHHEKAGHKEEHERVKKHWENTLTMLGEQYLEDDAINKFALRGDRGMSAYGL